MKYIDLFIQKIKDDKASVDTIEQCFLSDIIENHPVTIILGSPGSGKTSILTKYEQENSSKSQFVTIRRFLNPQFKVKENIRFLLLDGLDEYKTNSIDIDDVGYKIKELGNINAIITCRQADWYENSDTAALNSIIAEKVEVYNLLKLDNSKKEELAQLYPIENIYKFINEFDKYGFLENPQMFDMIAKLYTSDSYNGIDSKTDLYLQFIKFAIEKNKFYTDNNINELEKEELLKCVGYISLFYIFSGAGTYDKSFINNVASSESGFSKETLRKVLNTNLFSEKQFIHKTIAEFSAAHYLVNYKFSNSEGIQFERLKLFFTVNGKVPTFLRGCYTWLCSLTKDENLIDADPYNLLLNGDGDNFSPSLKLKLLSSIKNLSISNPHFVRGGDYYGFNPTEFYHSDLDDYILSIIEDITTINSEYENLIYIILDSSKNLSKRIIRILKNQFLCSSVENSIRSRLIQVFQNDSSLLLKVLNKIKNGLVKSDDEVIDGILNYLYPDTISHLKIVDYFHLYQKNDAYRLKFLEKTKYKDKKSLVKSIFNEIFNEIFKNDELNYNLTKMVNYFINDYLVETVLEYEKSLTAKDIYQVVSDLKAHDDFESFIELNFKFESFKPNLNISSELDQETLLKLSDELFDLFIIDKLQQNKLPQFSDFIRMFDRKFRPENISTIFLSHITQKNSEEQNHNLYSQALRSLHEYKQLDTRIKNRIENFAKTYNLSKELKLYKNPIKQDWEINDEIRDKELAIQNQLEIDKNEVYFKKLSDDDISKSFDLLNKISLMLFNIKHYQIPESNYLTDNTFNRLKRILKNLIYNPLNTDSENIKSLALSKTGTTRISPIDSTYYVSCSLNNEFTKKIKNKEFCKYLYILCQCKRSLGGVIKGSFLKYIDFFEIDEVETLKEYYRFMLDEKLPSYSGIIENYIRYENSKSRLINLSILSFNDNTTGANHILKAFIGSYLFEIEKQDLNELIDYKDMDTTNKSILNVLIAVNKNAIKISEEDVRCFFSLFSSDKKYFDSFTQNQKIKLLDLFMSTIEKPQSILDADYDEFGDFISRNGIYSLDLESIEELYQKRKTIHDSWSDSILQDRDELKQKQSDIEFNQHSIQSMRKYILNDSILDKKDFFTDVCLKINALKDDIEANRDQQKDIFYNSDSPKLENACRDALLIRLKDKYGLEFELSPEKQEAKNTRVDINIKNKNNLEYEVQVECKRDKNTPDIYTGIPNQLIEKYLSKNVEYGIYLIFYFGDLKNKSLLLKKIKKSLPKKFEDKIEIILIDLT